MNKRLEDKFDRDFTQDINNKETHEIKQPAMLETKGAPRKKKQNKQWV